MHSYSVSECLSESAFSLAGCSLTAQQQSYKSFAVPSGRMTAHQALLKSI
jgi:hypothetical protein